MIYNKNNYYFYRQNGDEWYIVELTDEDYKKENKITDYWTIIKPDFRCSNEKEVGPRFKTKQEAVRYICGSKFDVPSDPKNVEWHIEYTKKNMCDRSLYICHDCKIIMYHSMIWCFKCPRKVGLSKVTGEQLIKLYETGYKIGW